MSLAIPPSLLLDLNWRADPVLAGLQDVPLPPTVPIFVALEKLYFIAMWANSNQLPHIINLRRSIMYGGIDEENRPLLLEIKAQLEQIKSQTDLIEVKSDLTEVKSDLTEVKSDLTEVKSDLTEVRNIVKRLETSAKIVEAQCQT
ncbi:hypothetical protein TREMEDRAFT_58075 [Tremella mesenterica DSM 1558]|uniref:uncharacterized protein n=1 Tax=Tremella mesenterica (strain ATCC 24925 / CBS 8224 / DSM 1558 / NBRC 9311 / NRRL Y-6157 / RJB 2259-6 / UBC 559-6) TaxID=578456 RepID=UPI0003F49344|nr:uncharacterized protein TREMEDRAFT_58075 [Tremella mesenterica DSM 1558]EIW71935.1 hypothetical protein TREMEDRAFT_58075 [Tremella mesenterica DSM 1558]